MALKFLNAIIVFLLNMNWGIGDYTNIRCIESEREALLEFKYSLTGESDWLSSWGDEDGKEECCKWQGVQCSNTTGHVIKLDLKAHDLRGKLSHSLMELQSLEYLDLSFNYLVEDENLKWLSYLSSLEYLDLSYVYLYKANDWVEVVSGLSKLSTLKLSRCYLPTRNLSPSFFNASTSLVTLDLHQNYMSLSTSSILFEYLFKSTYKTLVSLDLSSNNVNGLVPSSFGKMVALRDLDLSDNQLEGMVPESFGNLCSLRSLNLSRNHLNGSLAFLHNFSSCANSSVLEILRLHSNSFSGSLPDDLSLFPRLKEIDVGNNYFNGTLSSSIGNLFELEILNVPSNSLQGVFSEQHLSNLSRLRILDLSSNSVTMKLSFNWFPPFNLEFLSLRSCKSGPYFPNWLATQKNIRYLDLSGNGIIGTIPKWFWDFTPDMHYLNLSKNQIHGRLPMLPTKFPSLLVLDMSSNSFDGPLPPFPTDLTILNLSNNFISDSIMSFCNSKSMLFQYLDLSNNQLSGVLLDHCVSRWTRLQFLNLANNYFSGEISSFFDSLPHIENLNLRNNSFSGELPWTLRTCETLKFLDLSDNKFSGNILHMIGTRLLSLEILIMQSNEFKGRIPLSLCELMDLQVLDLAENNIFGNIPQCFKSLRTINLSGNNLARKFSDIISSLYALNVLNLSRNNLAGELPQSIEEMTQLMSLDLSQNQFSGEIPMNLSKLAFIKHLNLSYNHFSGRISSSVQLKRFNADSYIGNDALCGPPITQNCPLEAPSDEFKKWLYIGLAMGFFVGFCGTFGSLLISRTWRHAYFSMLFKLKEWVLRRFALYRAGIQWSLQKGG
ncbi:hypothetical protein FNV43_RR15320 [Rhamnella rubrinervis]|uniref:Leucine-rich repeat-containing N-terminal plant-type domain-containing protein n=1 Tax=Rhamnella rubrinervis TaxID=2594499 RepID=A0A8K0E751_9ROSA|nr:hypothetical protein FNV43_RR15320 [Rhamnella rubrinervis]